MIWKSISIADRESCWVVSQALLRELRYRSSLLYLLDWVPRFASIMRTPSYQLHQFKWSAQPFGICLVSYTFERGRGVPHEAFLCHKLISGLDRELFDPACVIRMLPLPKSKVSKGDSLAIASSSERPLGLNRNVKTSMRCSRAGELDTASTAALLLRYQAVLVVDWSGAKVRVAQRRRKL
nr:hypothetical protein CFP56_11606 [Quercus suber]